ncbi:MAG: carbamate kinase [Enterococcus sp.]
MTKKVVVALGGNAILTDDPSAKGQQKALVKTAKSLVQLIQAGYQVVISHGNGPQVGNLLLQQKIGATKTNPEMPLDTNVAMTQGSIGYWLTQALDNELQEKGINQRVVGMLTQSIVDEKDPGFQNPTKPIGPFVSKEEAEAEMKQTSVIYKEDAGRGYRKVVASPKPTSIVEADAIKQMSDSGMLVVAGGGGGIPVIEKNGQLVGVEAVIDKDFASEKIAEMIDADELIILTGVANVAINYNQPNQEELVDVTVSELKAYIEENQFAPGSMLPKVEAAIAFVEARPQAKAVITSLDHLDKLLEGTAGTMIHSDQVLEQKSHLKDQITSIS